MAESLHEGHRARLRARFQETGLTGFQSHEILEMLLFYGIPRRDTNELAHRLINTFGSLHHVLEAPVHELAAVQGMTENAATLLHFSSALLAEYYADKYKAGKMLSLTEDFTNLLMPHYMHMQNETLYLVCLDRRYKLLNYSTVSFGNVAMVKIPKRLIIQRALSFNTSIAVLAHNHPSGVPVPSRDDIDATMELKKLFRDVDIHLHDHLIFADDMCVSMRDTPALTHLFE